MTFRYFIPLFYTFCLIQGFKSACALNGLRLCDPATECAQLIYQHERHKKIPTHLMMAISKTESGRYNAQTKKINVWPWTINVQGNSHYFDTKEEAVAHVKKLISRGISSIDVGCMQINLKHHPHAFTSIESAFDPWTNIDYAGRLLLNLKNTLGSWSQAVAHYHSTREVHYVPYRKKVYTAWLKEYRQQPQLFDLASTRPAPTQIPHTRFAQSSPLPHHHIRMQEARLQLARHRARAMNLVPSPSALKSTHLKAESKTLTSPKTPSRQSMGATCATKSQAQRVAGLHPMPLKLAMHLKKQRASSQ